MLVAVVVVMVGSDGDRGVCVCVEIKVVKAVVM